MPLITYLLFGIWQVCEVPNTPDVSKSETKKVTAYYFETKETERFFITQEIKHKCFLRVRYSFPKDAKEPLLEVISYQLESGVTHYGSFVVEKSIRHGYSQKAILPIGTTYFNVKF